MEVGPRRSRLYEGIWVGLGLCFFLYLIHSTHGGSSHKVKLRDVEVLTLREGGMTTGRRSSPVPQLTCVGGSGGCKLTPPIVQCYNRGSDGIDVQWECKAEMDKGLKFGSVEVICEGYDYPDDPYILAGSCGLEYRLDRVGGGYGGYYGGEKGGEGSGVGKMLMWGGILLMVYAFYKTCIPPTEHTDARSRTNDDFNQGQPPPPGFRSDYGSGGGGYGSGGGYGWNSGLGGDSCGGDGTRRRNNGGGGGFWTGAATGGLLGYMFGNRNGGRGGGGSGFGGSGFGGGGAPSSSSSSHTSSGFGGTRRR